MDRNGRLVVITGPMFSGKTEELVRELRRASFARRRLVVMRPAEDNRDGDAALVSRSGANFPSARFSLSADIVEAADDIDAQVVAIEEGQFCDDGLPDAVRALLADGRDVFVSGLDLDFAGRPYGVMPELLALADQVRKLTAICMLAGCSEDATRTQRLVNGSPASLSAPLNVVGGSEAGVAVDEIAYEARCPRHHRVRP